MKKNGKKYRFLEGAFFVFAVISSATSEFSFRTLGACIYI